MVPTRTADRPHGPGTYTHHGAQRQKKAGARGEESELHNARRHPSLRCTGSAAHHGAHCGHLAAAVGGPGGGIPACRAGYRRAQDLSGPGPAVLRVSSSAEGRTAGGSAYDRVLLFSQQRTAEQIIDIPVPHGRGGRGGQAGLQGVSQGQGPTTFRGADLVDIPVPRGGILHGPGSPAGSSHSPGAVDEV